jgi:hypothetical protein
MTNVKAQSSNETLNPKVLKIFDIKPFVIDLTFACLREAPPPEAFRRAGAPAKAGILTFDIHVEHIMVVPVIDL